MLQIIVYDTLLAFNSTFFFKGPISEINMSKSWPLKLTCKVGDLLIATNKIIAWTTFVRSFRAVTVPTKLLILLSQVTVLTRHVR